MLKGQDILVAVKLASSAPEGWTYPSLATALHMSASEVHASIKRAALAGLIDRDEKTARRAALREFLVHGVKYVFPPVWTAVGRGVPTAHGASPLRELILDDGLPPVWPHARGAVQGQGLRPIYASAPDAALADPRLHEWLALIDAIRSGRGREREAGVRLLTERLAGEAPRRVSTKHTA